MNKYNSPKDFDKTLKENKPRIVMPIINTIFSVILLVFVIIFTINKSFSPAYTALSIFILIMFPLSSWYMSYFSKKRNVKQIYNYQKETDIIVKYTARYKNFHPVSELDVKVRFYYEPCNQLDQKVTFNYDKCMIKEHELQNLLISFGITFGGVEVDFDTLEVLYPSGVFPCSIWYPKKFKLPNTIKGNLTVDLGDHKPNKKEIIQILKRADTYYDSKQGWICIGERKRTSLDEAIEFAEGAIIVLRDGEAVALFLEVGKNIQLA